MRPRSLMMFGVAGAVLAICGMPWWFARDGLQCYFTGDDAMNLHYYWTKPWSDILFANLAYYSPFYRPLGGLFYRSLFAQFGFDPLPFRIVAFSIMLFNLGLFYAIGRLLAESVEAGLLAALIGSYHGGFGDLYYSTGTIYDLLCLTFYAGALFAYMRARRQDRELRWPESVLVVALYICALNSKEMAATLPAAMLVYEWFWHRPQLSARGVSQWMLRNARFAWFLLAITVPYVYGKLSSTSSFAHNDAYQLHISLKTYLDSYRQYLDFIFYRQPGWFTPARAVALWGSMLALAALSRRKALWFSGLFVLFSVLPVIFITNRGSIFVLYIPYLGWSLYAAATVVLVRDLLVKVTRPTWAPVFSVILFAAVTVSLFAIHRRPGRDTVSENLVQSFTEQLHSVMPSIPSNSRILLLDDPFPKEEWTPLFLVHLSYKDPSILVDRVKMMEHPPSAEKIKSYGAVLTYRNEKLVRAVPGG